MIARGFAVVAVLVGIACIAAGLWPPAQAAEFPGQITATSPTERRIRGVLTEIEGAVRAGDVRALRALVSERYLASLERELAQLGGGLDGPSLHATGGFVGDLVAQPLAAGIGDGTRAVVIYAVGSGGFAGRELRAFVLDGADGDVRLDGKFVRRLDGADDAGTRADAWARELIDSR